jgi:hypothetical protein
MTDDELIARFVASLDMDQFFTHEKPPPGELNAGIDPEDWNCIRWKPKRIETAREELQPIYSRLHKPFPPLYERLVLTWRWLEAWTGNVRLFSNPPESSFVTLTSQTFSDPVFNGHLIANGYVPFGLDLNNYDPVCFDTNELLFDGDCRIVKFEHEAMLSFDRIGESWILWPSCRAMMNASCGKSRSR